MSNFNRDGGSRGGRRGGFGGGGRSFGGGRNFGGRSSYGRDDRGDGGDRQMFSVVCSKCGKDCQVPFRPTGDKPVYCSDCFEKIGGKNDRQSFDRPRREGGDRGNDNLRVQLESLNVKLDKIINLLQPQPVEEKTFLPEVVIEEPIKKAEAKPVKIKKAPKTKVEKEIK